MDLIIKDIQSQLLKVFFVKLARIFSLETIEAGKASGKKKRQAGAMKGMLVHMAEDFDAPLEDFKEYM